MNMQKDELDLVESDIDEYLVNILDRTIPRYKYIYHLNLAYIDLIIETGSLFMPTEYQWQFSLSYNTFLAYKLLSEEEKSDFTMNPKLYKYCMFMLVEGYHYADLCDVFTSVRSNKGELYKDGKFILYKSKFIPKKNLNYLSQYIPRKIMSYTFQTIVGTLLKRNVDEEEIELELTKTYLEFWSEYMKNDDFAPYDSAIWAHIESTYVLAACKRFVKLYKSDFNIDKFAPAKIMIVMSDNGISKIICDDKGNEVTNIKKALDDMTYKVLGKGLFPKSNVIDAPLIRTKDGYAFMNPLIYLFNISPESRHLNYLRKYDGERYSIAKANINERVIPIVVAMLKVKYPDIVMVCNFNVKIPNTKNEKRELDIFIVNQNGFALYIEVKHFYNPISQSERNILDNEFLIALDKMPKQINAIKYSWEILKKQYNIQSELKEVNGIILSHEYIGYDIPIKDSIPIVNVSNFNSTMVESDTIEDFYENCCKIDKTLIQLKTKSVENKIKYGKHEFLIQKEVIEPVQEAAFFSNMKSSIVLNYKMSSHKSFSSHEEAAKDFFDTTK